MGLLEDTAESVNALRDAYTVNLQHTNKAREQLIADGVPPAMILHVLEGIAALKLISHWYAVRHGEWKDEKLDHKTMSAKLLRVHSDVSNALEKGLWNTDSTSLPYRRGEEVNLADALIRICDLACARKLELAGTLIERLAYNATRHDRSAAGHAEPGGEAS